MFLFDSCTFQLFFPVINVSAKFRPVSNNANCPDVITLKLDLLILILIFGHVAHESNILRIEIQGINGENCQVVTLKLVCNRCVSIHFVVNIYVCNYIM